MLFLETFMTNLVLTNSPGQKRFAVAFTALILPVYVCYTYLGGGWQAGLACKTG
jgi:hypothetical protein